jgi:hypothetical protein
MRRVHRTHGRGGCGTRQREHYKERNQQVAMGSHEVGNGWNGRLNRGASCRMERDCNSRLERQEQADL